MTKFIFAAIGILTVSMSAAAQSPYFRLNQAGYLSSDSKVAIVISKTAISGDFLIKDPAGASTVFRGKLEKTPASDWADSFPYKYVVNFTALTKPGRYVLSTEAGARSGEFTIGSYPPYQEDLLFFMRQQRCGYNPYLDVVCHKRDGRAFYAPFPDGTFVDASGGWHDAGDQLKYLITASNATARMILAYELEKQKFSDTVDELGRPWPNGVPDVLDEAKWGLDWIFKLHPAADQLFHQVADDRDHRGFKLPDQDNADYGWGPNSYRPVYFADGKSQGLGQFKSKATGIANLAGRSAAAMAMGYRVWKNDVKDLNYAARCLKAAEELYAMGKRQEGYQQGNSFGAPYRYNEDTWADDMEWAAAELYKATGKPSYLADAKRFAKIAGTTSWMEFEDSSMGPDMSRHYERYPFTNIGHYSLYSVADPKTKAELAGYYRTGIEKIVARARTNSYGIGVPFLWCSNNLVVAFITQVMLYEKMTGEMKYHRAMLEHRDWLFGRNPWGTSMFAGIPKNGEFPEDTHLPLVQILKKQIPGGMVDGPIAAETFKGLIGLRLNQPDEFAEFQTDKVVYHDDVGDYSTNEPTMDGTADAILLMAALSGTSQAERAVRQGSTADRFTCSSGAIIRGDKARRKLALVFTGDEFAEGAGTIADVLSKRGVKASFFFTGRFYKNPEFRSAIERLKADRHYLGPHSDEHLLYADWNDRAKTLITREQFENDLNKNYAAMQSLGIQRADAKYFLPPYEWYNQTITNWTTTLGLKLINFTPGTRSNADYTTPDDKNYVSSDAILDSIKAYEGKDPAGLNGFILLMHIGAGPKRTDKFYERLDPLITWLRSRNYQMVRVDDLLSSSQRSE